MCPNTRSDKSPPIRLRLHSRNPIALVAAIRTALRREHAADEEISEFTNEALTQESPSGIRRYCEQWADIQIVA